MADPKNKSTEQDLKEVSSTQEVEKNTIKESGRKESEAKSGEPSESLSKSIPVLAWLICVSRGEHDTSKLKPVAEELQKYDGLPQIASAAVLLLDGLDYKETKVTVENILKGENTLSRARYEYWSEKLDLRKYQESLSELYEEVAKVSKESSDIKEIIAGNIDVALQSQAEAQQVNIDLLTKANIKLELEVKAKDEEIKKLKQSLSALPSPAGNKESKAVENEKKPVKKKILSSKKKGRETSRFILAFLDGDKYSPDAKEYLLQCYEKGLSLSDIEKFACPNLPVDMMDRLKNYHFGT